MIGSWQMLQGMGGDSSPGISSLRIARPQSGAMTKTMVNNMMFRQFMVYCCAKDNKLRQILRGKSSKGSEGRIVLLVNGIVFIIFPFVPL